MTKDSNIQKRSWVTSKKHLPFYCLISMAVVKGAGSRDKIHFFTKMDSCRGLGLIENLYWFFKFDGGYLMRYYMCHFPAVN
jgi:hypothetical protein